MGGRRLISTWLRSGWEIRLPFALRETDLLFGQRNDLSSNRDVLLDPVQLYVGEAGEALVFWHEDQGAASWTGYAFSTLSRTSS